MKGRKKGPFSRSKMKRGLFQSPVPQPPPNNVPEEIDTDEHSHQSSSLSSHRTTRLAALFPNKRTPRNFNKSSLFFHFLTEGCDIDQEFLSRLETLGYTTPTTVVNRFGGTERSITNTFALMGPHYILDEQHLATGIQLVIFARTQFLRDTSSKGRFTPLMANTSDEWQDKRKTPEYSDMFENMGQDEYDNLFDDLRDADFLEEADILLRNVRQQIRSWIRSVDKDTLKPDDHYHTPERNDLQEDDQDDQVNNYWSDFRQDIIGDDTEPPLGFNWASIKKNDDPPSLFPTPRSQSSPADTKAIAEFQLSLDNYRRAAQIHEAQLTQRYKQFHSNMTREIATLVNTVKTVKKQLMYTGNRTGSPDNDPSDSSDHISSLDSDEEWNHSYPPNLPIDKQERKPHQQFKANKNRNGLTKYGTPISPKDPRFHVGCNDDLLDLTTVGTEGTVTSQQRKHQKHTEDWLTNMRRKTKTKLANLCTNNIPLKRTSVPSSLAWNGKSGNALESFIDKFTGHIIQQSHMGYILNDKIAILWLKHGDAEIVLRLGMQRNLHTSLTYISPTQFEIDVQWLYGALKQCLTIRGFGIIKALSESQDGILAWKRFLVKYRYNGDVHIYVREQQQIITTPFSSQYPGGMLQYLEDVEDAFLNIDYVLKDEPEYVDAKEGTLYSDSAKRTTFVTYFSVPGLTADLIDTVEQNTRTWDEMTSSLRKRLARRTTNAQITARRRAHLVSQDLADHGTLPSLAPSVPQALSTVQDACINALGQEWKIGQELWNRLPSDLRNQVLDHRRRHLPLDSGGGSMLLILDLKLLRLQTPTLDNGHKMGIAIL